MDLFDTAAQNAPALEKRSDELLTALKSPQRDLVRTFFERVRDDGRISINMKLSDIQSFLNTGRYWNTQNIPPSANGLRPS